jgi:lysophospholipase L1-like esterase
MMDEHGSVLFNPLYGKRLALNGDSICQGVGFKGGYGRMLAERNQMQLQNVAIGGGTITAEQYYSEEHKPRHWISRTIDQMDADADYAIVEGGVNDASLRVPMGEISQGFAAKLDDTTFCGAFESMLRQLTIRYAGKKIGYVAVHKMTVEYSTEDDAFGYYQMAKRCCEKWGVPFCDLNASCPAFGLFPKNEAENSALYAMRQIYTHNGDGWHPSEEGYRRYYCDKIEAWMRTL